MKLFINHFKEPKISNQKKKDNNIFYQLNSLNGLKQEDQQGETELETNKLSIRKIKITR